MLVEGAGGLVKLYDVADPRNPLLQFMVAGPPHNAVVAEILNNWDPIRKKMNSRPTPDDLVVNNYHRTVAEMIDNVPDVLSNHGLFISRSRRAMEQCSCRFGRLRCKTTGTTRKFSFRARHPIASFPSLTGNLNRMLQPNQSLSDSDLLYIICT